jgi:hypothetical protein
MVPAVTFTADGFPNRSQTGARKVSDFPALSVCTERIFPLTLARASTQQLVRAATVTTVDAGTV